MKGFILHRKNNAKKGDNNNHKRIYASMVRMSDNDKSPSRDCFDSSQLTYCILNSGAMSHMTPHVSDFITGSLEYTDKHIEVSDRHQIMIKEFFFK